MVLGEKSPTEIAKKLDRTHSSVSQQLKIMRKQGIVKPPTRKWREQHHEINWPAIVKGFIENAPLLQEALERTSLRAHYFSEAFRDKIKKIPSTLSKNATFKELIANYFRFIAKQVEQDYFRAMNIYGTIFDCIGIFEKSLIAIFPLIKKESIDDKAFLSALEAWYVLGVQLERYENAAIQEALKALGSEIKSFW